MRKRSVPYRIVRTAAVCLSALVLVISVGGYAVQEWFNSTVARVHLSLGAHRPPKTPAGSQNWLLVGTDNTATDQFGVRSGTRSDTTILTHLDADGTATNVSFPRDTLVTIPAYVDKQLRQWPAHQDKFNAAISLGGPSLLIRTVEKLTNLHIDHYVSVDLDGFEKISNVLDGVEVCIRPTSYTYADDHAITNINDGNSGFHGVYGPQKVAGAQALAFVRQRHGLPDEDLDRIQRQQQFLGSVFREATANHFLFNPVKVAELVEAIKGAITLDYGTSLADLEKLALRLRGVDPSKVSFETIPQHGLEFSDTDLGAVTPYQGLAGGIPTLTPNGQTHNIGSVQVLDKPGLEAMLAPLRDKQSKPSVVVPSKPVTSEGTSTGSSAATPTPGATPTVNTAASAGNRCTY
ncbi:MAG TPA: LCP family protein [Frankiaceae bacterium]|nr:LCP family protein [Frankiaceae bacterium]